jgi:transcriptional regulator with XRE-family HTH domain
MRKSTHTPEYGLLRDRLTAVRKSASLSQRDLAAALGVPHSWVAKVESGERRIDLIEFAWFCNACGGSAAETANAVFSGISKGSAAHHRSRRRGK